MCCEHKLLVPKQHIQAGQVNPNTNAKQQLAFKVASQQWLQFGNMRPTHMRGPNHSRNQHKHQTADLLHGNMTTLQPMVANRQGTPILELGAGIPADHATLTMAETFL